MDHTHIAKVFDGGATEVGRPYFVMEYVPGVSITEYCDLHRLTVRERLELIIPLCQAVQHAHQKGVIHRDLKPSNILVADQDGGAIPKIIDFGIAKATGLRLTEKSLHTQRGQVIGTPAYMSPEQAEMSGLDVDTRTDIYSLGVILYELLTGALPFLPKDLEGLAALLTLRETEPPTPSTRFGTLGNRQQRIAECRRTDPRSLMRNLKGDLDWITMKAMEKDRSRRYETASELAVDIGRYLNGQTVLARAPSTGYRVKKFVRRHTAGVAFASVLLLLLVGFAVAMSVQAARIARERDRANLEAATAQQVSDFIVDLFAVSDPNQARGNEITAREILDKGAEEIEEGLED
jgi:non-specific serine/threonine protein kinase/serine/threonine-protein kinase